MIVNKSQVPFFVLLFFFTSCHWNKESNKRTEANNTHDSLSDRAAQTREANIKYKDSHKMVYDSAMKMLYDSASKMFYDSTLGFWIDPSEINSNEYKQYPAPDTRDSNKNYKKKK